ncbi:MAG: zinc-finger domain-containing protein [Pseudomonadota bacterium]
MTTGTPTEPGKMPDMDPPEVETVTATRISCDGGGGALGHPRVWLSIDPKVGFVECGYCDKRFVLEGGGHHA